jgi:hypothetical protein
VKTCSNIIIKIRINDSAATIITMAADEVLHSIGFITLASGINNGFGVPTKSGRNCVVDGQDNRSSANSSVEEFSHSVELRSEESKAALVEIQVYQHHGVQLWS